MPPDPPCPEMRVAMALARLDQNIQTTVGERELGALDWRRLVDICGKHKLVRPLMNAIPRLPCRVPPWVRRSLLARLRRNEQTSRLLTTQLCRLCEFLSDEAVEFRIMRGPALSQMMFDDPDKREIGDLDIVVDRGDVERTRQLLGARGFCSGESEIIVAQNRAYQMFSRELGVGVDLHWSTVPGWLPVGKGSEAATGSTAWLTLNDTRVPTFDREDTLVLQCVQCLKTAWVELDRWYDFAALCARWSDVDWDRVLRTCEAHGYLRSLSLTLRLLGQTTRNNLPEKALRRLAADPDLDSAERMVLARLPELEQIDRFRGRSEQMMSLSRTHLPGWLYAVYRMSSTHLPIATWWLVTDDARQRWVYAWRMIRVHLSPKQADYDAVSLPRSLHFLYYLIRPSRLVYRRLVPRH